MLTMTLAANAQIMKIYKGSTLVASYKQTEADKVVFEEISETHEFVDLGLSVKWATCNIGADKPEDYGDYFAWGETTGYNSGKTYFDWSTYKWCNGSSSTMTKYCTQSKYGTVDNKTVLDPADDAATVNWGGDWRMPTSAELQELLDNCTWSWTQENGVNGYRVTSKKVGYTDKSIFLPAAGYRWSDRLSSAGSNGYYWSSSLLTDSSGHAWFLNFHSGYRSMNDDLRSNGHSVRAVCP